jgi:hypothetical protein
MMGRRRAFYSQEDADREERHGTTPRTTSRSLVRDHLNFAQVEALNVHGFEDVSRLPCTCWITFYCREVKGLNQVPDRYEHLNQQPPGTKDRYTRIRLVYQGLSTDRDSPR